MGNASHTLVTVAFVACLAATGPSLGYQEHDYRQLAECLLREMVALRTSAAHPAETARLLEGVAERLRDEGFAADDVELVVIGEVTNLVARLPGSGDLPPVVTMAHVDVVDADPDAWQADPFTLAEIDGYYYGRGTIDNKGGAATLVTNFIRLHREGVVPKRDLVLALTGDEETGMEGIRRLVEHPWIAGSELALNSDSGGGILDANGEPLVMSVQMAEKLYQTFELEATNPGGHSSRPRPDNAIYDLADALVRLRKHRFPLRISEAIREAFRVQSRITPGITGELMARVAESPEDTEAAQRLAAADPVLNATMRTTCVATMLDAGVAENALPRRAKATVNCRIFPGVDPGEIRAVLEQLAGPDVVVRPVGESAASPQSPLREDVLEMIRRATHRTWGEIPVAPEQSTYATDGLWVRNAGIPVYGVGGLFHDPGEIRTHGLDERVGIESFHQGVEFWYRLLLEMAR